MSEAKIANHPVEIWVKIIKRARQRFRLPLNELHGDTTSIYFEGEFLDPDPAAAKTAETQKTKEQLALPTEIEKEPTKTRIPRLTIGYNKDGQRDKKQMVLSPLNVGRVPIWFCPWDGNKSDDGVCLNDLKELRSSLLAPENALLIGDRKTCQEEPLLDCSRNKQRLLAPHPWTPTAKQVWLETFTELESGKLQWQRLDYVSQNNARKPEEKRPLLRACEVSHQLKDKQFKTSYDFRWIFVHSSTRAESDLRTREKALRAGEKSLDRLAKLVGKYQYRKREVITQRIDQELRRAKASGYFNYTLSGTDGERDWQLKWERHEEAIKQAESFDGISLLCTNAPSEELSANDAVSKYKEQIGVEQTIDFIKSPVQIRPTWLHLPKRILGLTLLIMIAVLVAMLLEFEVGRLLKE